MKIVFKGEYGSLQDFVWDNETNLSIITGANGVGKTQLINRLRWVRDDGSTESNEEGYSLKVENFKWGNAVGFDSSGHLFRFEDSFADFFDFLTVAEGLYLYINRNRSDIATIRERHEKRRQRAEELHESYLMDNRRGFFNDFDSRYPKLDDKKLEYVAEKIIRDSGKAAQLLTVSDILIWLPEFIIAEEGSQNRRVEEGLSYLFYAYALKKAALEMQGKEVGYQSPWDVLSQVFHSVGLPMEFNSPDVEEIKGCIRDTIKAITSTRFKVKMTNKQIGKEIKFNSLSSGERILGNLALMLYRAQQNDYGRIILLDEPDAHLHPSMTQNLFKVLYDVMVKKYDVKVILSTHKATTVALAPDSDDVGVYRMTKKPTRIERVSNRQEVINELSEGLVLVTPMTKYVLVEGKDDVNIYPKLFNILRERNLIEGNYAFIDAGGKGGVMKFLSAMKKNDLGPVFTGIIDLDTGNSNIDGLVLGRYSLENYLVDPVLVLLASRKKPAEFNGILAEYSEGNESEIMNADKNKLQDAVEKVLNAIRKRFPAGATMNAEPYEIEFVNGLKLVYPGWLLFERGKDILIKMQEVFSTNVNLPELLTYMRRTGMIPLELVEKLKSIKSNDDMRI